MLESKQYSAFWLSFDCSAVHSVMEGSVRYLQQLGYYISPEDTTEMTDKNTVRSDQLKGQSTRGSYLKLVCWIAVSIAASLALGQLH